MAALYHDERPWNGLITTDDGMLKLPKEMSVLCQTKLTLVIAEAAGHDPLTASGLLLAHLPSICKQTKQDRPQLWRLRARRRKADDPWDHIRKWAIRHGENPRAVYRRHKLPG